MTRVIFAALLAALALVPAAAGAADRHPLTIRDVVAFERVSDPQASPDGRHLAYVLRTTDMDANKGVRSIWLMDLKTGNLRKFASGSGNSDTPQWSPDSKYVYFLSTRSGSSQVWRQGIEGEAQAVTQLPLDVGSFKLSPRADRIVVSLEVFADCATLACSKKRLDDHAASKASGVLYDKLFVRHWDTWANGSRSQLFVASLKADGSIGDTRLLTRGIDGDVPSKPFGDASEYSFTPDGKSLIFSARIAGRTEAWSTNFDLYSVELEGKKQPVNLTADNLAWDAQPLVTPNGRSLVYLAMKRPGFEADRFHIMVRDLRSGKTRELAPKWDRSPDRIALSENGSTLYATADELGQKPIFALNLVGGGSIKKLTGEGNVSGFNLSEDGLVFVQNNLAAPDDLYRIAWNGTTTQLTRHNAAQLAAIEMAPYEQFSFEGAGGDKVYGYVMKPAGYEPGKKYPTAFIIHGGPQGSMGNDFHYRWNPEVFAGMGYSVVWIDFHGSTGYGQAFTDSISGDWGGKPLEDLKKGLAYAAKTYDYVDADHACALGASYGGFMVNWIASQWNDGFKCLVTHDGVFDSRSMAYATEELWFDEWEHGGTPYDKPEAYERFNPAAHVAQWKTPMLIVHGQLDYRIPVEQGLAAFTALQRRGIDSQFLYFADENHWVLKPHNSIQWYDTVQAWLDHYLKPKS
jgi:dipeptidyl aminopeptidase/acylaminoacyl peptidase